jgi:hypothetical protein
MVLSMAAAQGEPVTQAHTDKCARDGHARWTRDGRDTGVCARCGDVTREDEGADMSVRDERNRYCQGDEACACGGCLGTVERMTDEELREAYNAALKPNAYGAEMLRRVHARDREAFGMSADNPRLRG